MIDHSVRQFISLRHHTWTLRSSGVSELEWVDWFNHHRLLEPIGVVPPAEAQDQFYAPADNIDMAASLTTNASGRPSPGQFKKLFAAALVAARVKYRV
jgi:hypothetical protein